MKQVTTSSRPEYPGVLNFMKSYLDVGSYLCLIPWKLSGPSHVANSHLICRGITAVLHVFTIFHIFWRAIIHPIAEADSIVSDSPNKKKMMALVLTVWLICVASFIFTVWSKKRLFERIMVQSQKIEKMLESVKMDGILPSKRMVAHITWMFVAFLVFLTCIDAVGVDLGLHKYKNLYSSIMHTTNYEYFFQNDLLDLDENQPTALKFVAVYRCLVGAYGLVLTFYSYCFAVAISMLLFWLTKGFLRVATQRDILVDVDQVLDIFDALMEMSDLYEECLGSMISCYCLVLLPMHSFKFKQAMTDGDPWKYVPVLLYLLVWLSFMFISSHANYMLKSITRYLRPQIRRLGTITFEKVEYHQRLSIVSVLINEISGNNFGIRGIGFTITYGLFGNLVGLVVTCVIIISQINIG